MRVSAPIARFSRRLAGVVAFTLTGGALAGCDLNPNVDAATLTIAPSNVIVAVNNRVQIVGTAFDSKGNSIRDKKISYSTANPSIATVSADGFVIGISVGSTTVSANASGKSATATVTVTPELVNTITINPPAFTLRVGNVKPFTATLKNAGGTVITKTVRWASSNTAIATVDQNGIVTAIAPGNVQVTADVDQVIAATSLQVTLVPIGSCAITPLTQTVTVGVQVQPTLVIRDTANTVLPQLNRTIIWTSDNEIVATVSQTGLVTTRKAGSAGITASPAENPSISCRTSVTAVDPTVSQVVIQQRNFPLRIGIDRQISALVLDSVQAVIPNRTVTWTSLTPTIARISSLGIITGLQIGTARIQASVDGKSDTVSYPVTKVPVGTVTITPLQISILETGMAQFRAEVKDSTGAIVTDRPLQWLTTNPTIATVDANGLARGRAPGTVTITVTSEDRGASANLIVLPTPVDTITAPLTFSLVRGATSGFTITLLDAAGNEIRNRVVEAKSDLPNVAQVPTQLSQSSTIVVQGITVGEAVISLQALNSSGQAEGKRTFVRVTVTAPPTGISSSALVTKKGPHTQ